METSRRYLSKATAAFLRCVVLPLPWYGEIRPESSSQGVLLRVRLLYEEFVWYNASVCTRYIHQCQIHKVVMGVDGPLTVNAPGRYF